MAKETTTTGTPQTAAQPTVQPTTSTPAPQPTVQPTVNTTTQTATQAPVSPTVTPTTTANTVTPANTSTPNTPTQEAEAKDDTPTAEVPQTEADKTPEKTTLNVSQSLDERIKTLEVMAVRGILTVDQAAELENLQQQKNGAEGLTEQKENDDVRRDEPKPSKFKEMDVIAYMYENWLIAGAEWCGRKAEKYGGAAWDRLMYRMMTAARNKAAKDEEFKKSKTYQTMETVKKLKDEKTDEANKKFKQDVKDVTQIARAINNGTIIDPPKTGMYENLETGEIQKGTQVTPMNKLEKLLNVENDENGRNYVEHIKTLCEQRKAAAEAIKVAEENKKNNKDAEQNAALKKALEDAKKEGEKAQKALGEAASKFAEGQHRNLEFSLEVQQTAINIAGANVMDDVLRNPNSIADAKKAYEDRIPTTVNDLNKATIKDREKFLAPETDEEKKAKMLSTVDVGLAFVATAINPAAGILAVNASRRRAELARTTGDLESLHKLSKAALGRSLGQAYRGNGKEFPPKKQGKDNYRGNEPLNKYNELIGKKLNGQELTQEDKTQATQITNDGEQELINIVNTPDEPEVKKKDEQEDLRTAVNPSNEQKTLEVNLLDNERAQGAQDAKLDALHNNPIYARTIRMREGLQQKRALDKLKEEGKNLGDMGLKYNPNKGRG